MKKFLMGSIVLTTFAFAILLFQMSSCKKTLAQTNVIHDTVKINIHDTVKYCPASVYPIQGLWVGTYSVDALPSQGQLFASLIIYPDGTIVTRTKGGDGKYYYASGTWNLSSSNVLTATIVYFVTPGTNPVTQSITATFSSTGVLTLGTWKDVINTNSTPLNGAFSEMQRVN